MFDFKGYQQTVFEGAIITLEVALLSLVIAVALGLITALASLANSKAIRLCATLYTTIIRSIPDLILMLLVFYGGQVLANQLANAVGYNDYIDIDPFVAGVITIGFIFGAYMAETFRGAINAVGKGQLEAASAYGMSRLLMYRRILLPQMVRHALPGFSNNWLVLMKSTALVSVIGLDDMVRKASLAAGVTKLPFSFYVLVALIFLLFTTLSIIALSIIEKRYALKT